MSDSEQQEPQHPQIPFKRLIVCCDGTGQSATDGSPAVPTNVTRFARALMTSLIVPPYLDDPAQEIPQIVLYQTGIGTANDVVNNVIHSEQKKSSSLPP